MYLCVNLIYYVIEMEIFHMEIIWGICTTYKIPHWLISKGVDENCIEINKKFEAVVKIIKESIQLFSLRPPSNIKHSIFYVNKFSVFL